MWMLLNHVVTSNFSCIHHKMYSYLLLKIQGTINVFRYSLNYLYKIKLQSYLKWGFLNHFRFIPPQNVFAPPEENPDNECFCLIDEGCNVPRGLFNMSACQFGSPTMMSWPHFLDVSLFLDCGNQMTSIILDWKIQTDVTHVKTIQYLTV